MSRIFIDSLEDPRVRMYRDLKTSNFLRDEKLFIAEGIRLVERLLASDYRVQSVLVSERRVEEWAEQIPVDVPLYVLPQQLGEQLTGFNFHVGVLACGHRKPPLSLDDLLPKSEPPTAAPSRTLAICPNCDNPENLGTIIRIGAAFGIDGLLLSREGCCDPFSRRVLRVSMGTAFQLPIIESPDLARDVQRLRDEWQFELIASVLDESAEPLSRAARGQRVGILVGNEAAGLDEQWRGLCSRHVTIPMSGGTDSLNVAIAAGIFLHHFTMSASTAR